MRGTRCGAGIAACALALAGCTSISWDDADGRRHHLGLVAARIEEADGATIVRRYALGSDLDVSRGGAWTIGAGVTERVDVTASHTVGPRTMDAEYLAALRSEPHRAPAAATWRLLWFSEDASPRAALVQRDLVGLAFAAGPELRGAVAGYAHAEAIDPRAMGTDAALYVSRRDGYRPRYRMWRLSSEEAGARPAAE